MALQTKTITGSTVSSNWSWKMEIIENSISVENNTSSITVKSYLGRPYSASYFGGSANVNITCNGDSRTTNNKSFSYPTNVAKEGWALIQTENFNVEHNTDGKKTISVSSSLSNASFTPSSASASGEMELTYIPRASSVSGGSGNIDSATKISISRASDTFKHTLEYEFGDLSGTIATNVEESYNWTIPTSFYAEIPNSNSGTGTIICKTYSDDKLVGTDSIEFTVKVVNSNPVIGTFTYKDSNSNTVAITGNNQRIIRNNSNLLFTIGSATPKNSASISKYEITFNNVVKSRTSVGDLDFGKINLSSNSTATLKVIDSRGNIATKEITIIIDNWMLPTGLITLNRKNNFYSETYLTVDGTYSSLNGKNAMTIQYQYKEVSTTEFSKLKTILDNAKETIDLDNNYQWNIKVVITDKIGTTTYNLFLDRGMPIAFFDRLLSSVGINCFPTLKQSLEVFGNFLLNNKSIVDLIYPVGSIYMSVNSTNPTTNFGGTWEQITDSNISSIGYIWKRTK